MSVFFNFSEIEKCNSIVPKGHRNYSFFSFKSSIFIPNERSRHVLEKVGFRPLREEGDFKYYCIIR